MVLNWEGTKDCFFFTYRCKGKGKGKLIRRFPFSHIGVKEREANKNVDFLKV